ncbi:MAG: hypothetical protein Q7S02_05900, partial [bacterium]|nr:hypothetical protein [bacterium]
MHRALREFIRNAGAPALVAGALAIVIPSFPLIGALAIALLLILFAVWPMLGWSLVVLTYPFIYLQLFIGSTINIPYVDLLAMLTFAGVALRFFIDRYRGRHSSFIIHHSSFPGLVPFLTFIAVAALSLLNVDDLA